jgi:uncharacterized protein YndB with AHSA1/START domain
MTSWQLTVEHRIAAPASKVWEALTDIEGSPHVISGIERVEMLSEAPFGVGTRWRETRRVFDKDATEELWVTACEAPVRYVVEAESRGVHYTSEFLLNSEQDGGTCVRLVFGGSRTEKNALGGVIGKLFGGLGAKTVEKALTKDLEDVAASVESPR